MFYDKASLLGGGVQADVDTVELDVAVITDGEDLVNSQLSIFWNIALGTHTSMNFKYYVRYAVGGSWYELPYRNEGTGAITSVPSIADGSTPTKFVDSLPLPACVGFKATAKGVGGANGSADCQIMGRDN